MAISESIKHQNLKPTEEFSINAAAHETPVKNTKIKREKSTHTPSFTESSKKSLIVVHKLEEGKLNYKTVD